MSKSSKLYKDSPALERDGDGNMQAVRPSEKSDGAGAGEDGSDAEMQGNASHEEERASMHKRHEEEQKAMHDRHHKDMKEMHKRHEAKKESK